MPEETVWESFFDPDEALAKLLLEPRAQLVVEFGCGYGTFTIPAARRCAGIAHTFDIEAELVAQTSAKAEAERLSNVRAEVRDFMAHGTGLAAGAADYVMLFNILHAERPALMLNEAARVLKTNGRLGIMHWNCDPNTPRGPSMDIRPKPEQCREWAIAAGFSPVTRTVSLPPFHYGIVLER